MTMTPCVRKLALITHVATSVGWLGSVAAFLALAIAALTSPDAQIVRSAFFAMELTGWYVIVPLCLASLLTGLIQSLGTTWGLFRHYWVVSKLLITVISAIILFGFSRTLTSLGDLAADMTLSIIELRNLRQSPVLHSGGGLLVLLVTTTLSVYKPWGLTAYGRRTQRNRRQILQPDQRSMHNRGDMEMDDLPSNTDPSLTVGVESDRELSTGAAWRPYVLIAIIVLALLLFIVLHLTGSGLSGLHTPSS